MFGLRGRSSSNWFPGCLPGSGAFPGCSRPCFRPLLCDFRTNGSIPWSWLLPFPGVFPGGWGVSWFLCVPGSFPGRSRPCFAPYCVIYEQIGPYPGPCHHCSRLCSRDGVPACWVSCLGQVQICRKSCWQAKFANFGVARRWWSHPEDRVLPVGPSVWPRAAGSREDQESAIQQRANRPQEESRNPPYKENRKENPQGKQTRKASKESKVESQKEGLYESH